MHQLTTLSESGTDTREREGERGNTCTERVVVLLVYKIYNIHRKQNISYKIYRWETVGQPKK